jgi:hypothetical protein
MLKAEKGRWNRERRKGAKGEFKFETKSCKLLL